MELYPYIAFVSIQVLLIPFIIVFNILVIAVPILWEELSTPDNILMMNLAAVDLITGCITMPLTFIGTNSHIEYLLKTENEYCFLYWSGLNIPSAMSFFTLVAMSADKLINVKYPEFYRQSMKAKQAKWTILFLWIMLFAFYFIALSLYTFDADILDLDQRCDLAKNNFRREWKLIAIGVLGVCLLINVVSASYFVYKACQRKRTRSLKRTLSYFERNHNMGAGVVAGLILLMILCYIPTMVKLIIQQSAFKFTNQDDVNNLFYIIWLPVFFNIALNAPIYAYFRDRNRHAYYYLLHTWPWKWYTLSEAMNRREELECIRTMANLKGIDIKDAHIEMEAFNMKRKRSTFEVDLGMTESDYQKHIIEMNKDTHKIQTFKNLKKEQYTRAEAEQLTKIVFKK